MFSLQYRHSYLQYSLNLPNIDTLCESFEVRAAPSTFTFVLLQPFITIFNEFISLRQVILETEYDNAAALSLYESLGFIREKRLFRFYLNGKDAFRLVFAVAPPEEEPEGVESEDTPTPR